MEQSCDDDCYRRDNGDLSNEWGNGRSTLLAG